MKIIIMGAGIIGVTTAYFLAKQGNEVIVLEKGASSGLGCSYANGCQLSYSHTDPLASIESLKLLLKSFFQKNSFLYVRKFFNKDFFMWAIEFLKNCKLDQSKNEQKLLAISTHSKLVLASLLSEEVDIKFDYNDSGILYFYRTEKIFQKAITFAKAQKLIGHNVKILNKEECVKKESTLVKLYDDNKLAGGILYKEDASGDCFLFLKSLEKICKEKYGVKFLYNVDIKNIFTNYKTITGVNTSAAVFTADKYVYALGAYENNLLKGISIKSKIYPFKGYSLSTPSNQSFIAPKTSITDKENKIVYSRVGETFRAAGVFEINGFKADKGKNQLNFLYSNISSTFSDFGNINKTLEWCGFRPFRPNSIPLICEVKKYENLFLNTGHGHLGWTLACGSADILAKIISKSCDEKFKFLEEELCY
jgi:D-amino-acid dehydrogenase